MSLKIALRRVFGYVSESCQESNLKSSHHKKNKIFN